MKFWKCLVILSCIAVSTHGSAATQCFVLEMPQYRESGAEVQLHELSHGFIKHLMPSGRSVRYRYSVSGLEFERCVKSNNFDRRGTHTFSATVVDNDGVESEYSTPVQKLIN